MYLHNNTNFEKNHFELYDSFVPIFRLLLIAIILVVGICRNGPYLYDSVEINVSLWIYFIYSLIILVFRRVRKLLAFRYPFIMALFEILLTSCAVSFSGYEASPFYLLYIIIISFFAIVYSLRYALITGTACAVFFTAVVALDHSLLSYDYIFRLVFLLAFSLFTGYITERIQNHDITLATTDNLTMLNNRQYFYEALEHMLANESGNMRLTLIFIDVDNFKKINDQNGHLEGDRILAEIGSVIGHTIRKGDIAARYGGDEFAVALPGTDREGGAALCARIMSGVSADLFNSVTISTGLAVYPFDGRSAQELLRTADAEMYRAKAQRKGAKDAGK